MKLASILAIAFLLTAMMAPSAACCSGKTAGTAMRMSMPCCGDHCRVMSSRTAAESSGILAAVPASPLPAINAAIVSAAPAIAFEIASDRGSAEFDSPPTFLAHHQFRI